MLQITRKIDAVRKKTFFSHDQGLIADVNLTRKQIEVSSTSAERRGDVNSQQWVFVDELITCFVQLTRIRWKIFHNRSVLRVIQIILFMIDNLCVFLGKHR